MEGVADDAEGLIERLHELVGDDVVAEGGLGVEDPLGEPEDEPVGGQRLGDLDQVAEECHGGGRAWQSRSGGRRRVIVRHEPPPQRGKEAPFQPGSLGLRLDPKPVPRRLLADRLPLLTADLTSIGPHNTFFQKIGYS